LSNTSLDVRLRRKAVRLLADLAAYQLENVDREEQPFFNDQDLLKAVVDLTTSTDLDLQEKVIVDTAPDTIVKALSNDLFCL